MLIKYIKSLLWRVAKRLSYIEDAWCLKVNASFLLRAVKCCHVQAYTWNSMKHLIIRTQHIWIQNRYLRSISRTPENTIIDSWYAQVTEFTNQVIWKGALRPSYVFEFFSTHFLRRFLSLINIIQRQNNVLKLKYEKGNYAIDINNFIILCYINIWLHVMFDCVVICRSYELVWAKLHLQISFSVVIENASCGLRIAI